MISMWLISDVWFKTIKISIVVDKSCIAIVYIHKLLMILSDPDTCESKETGYAYILGLCEYHIYAYFEFLLASHTHTLGTLQLLLILP